MKKYKLPEDVFDEISLQKSELLKKLSMPIEVYISNDVWNIINKKASEGFTVTDKVMGLKIFIASSPVQYLINYIKVV